MGVLPPNLLSASALAPENEKNNDRKMNKGVARSPMMG
jgi:hypothetical protein